VETGKGQKRRDRDRHDKSLQQFMLRRERAGRKISLGLLSQGRHSGEIKGAGEAQGGPRDFYLTCRIRDRQFLRKESELTSRVPDAATGTSVRGGREDLEKQP